MKYNFWGWEQADVPAIDHEYKGINTALDLYETLQHVWCLETCTPRLRSEWSEENNTVGQCTITAFLVQDIFGGKVYGILRPGGNYHSFNVIGDHRFDLTSEQFGDEKLDYDHVVEQFRETHFATEDKKLRYEELKRRLKEWTGENR